MFTDYHVVELFGLKMTNFVYVPILWLALGAAFVAASRFAYLKYEVKSR